MVPTFSSVECNLLFAHSDVFYGAIDVFYGAHQYLDMTCFFSIYPVICSLLWVPV